MPHKLTRQCSLHGISTSLFLIISLSFYKCSYPKPFYGICLHGTVGLGVKPTIGGPQVVASSSLVPRYYSPPSFTSKLYSYLRGHPTTTISTPHHKKYSKNARNPLVENSQAASTKQIMRSYSDNDAHNLILKLLEERARIVKLMGSKNPRSSSNSTRNPRNLKDILQHYPSEMNAALEKYPGVFLVNDNKSPLKPVSNSPSHPYPYPKLPHPHYHYPHPPPPPLSLFSFISTHPLLQMVPFIVIDKRTRRPPPPPPNYRRPLPPPPPPPHFHGVHKPPPIHHHEPPHFSPPDKRPYFDHSPIQYDNGVEDNNELTNYNSPAASSSYQNANNFRSDTTISEIPYEGYQYNEQDAQDIDSKYPPILTTSSPNNYLEEDNNNLTDDEEVDNYPNSQPYGNLPDYVISGSGYESTNNVDHHQLHLQSPTSASALISSTLKEDKSLNTTSSPEEMEMRESSENKDVVLVEGRQVIIPGFKPLPSELHTKI